MTITITIRGGDMEVFRYEGRKLFGQENFDDMMRRAAIHAIIKLAVEGKIKPKE